MDVEAIRLDGSAYEARRVREYINNIDIEDSATNKLVILLGTELVLRENDGKLLSNFAKYLGAFESDYYMPLVLKNIFACSLRNTEQDYFKPVDETVDMFEEHGIDISGYMKETPVVDSNNYNDNVTVDLLKYVLHRGVETDEAKELVGWYGRIKKSPLGRLFADSGEDIADGIADLLPDIVDDKGYASRGKADFRYVLEVAKLSDSMKFLEKKGFERIGEIMEGYLKREKNFKVKTLLDNIKAAYHKTKPDEVRSIFSTFQLLDWINGLDLDLPDYNLADNVRKTYIGHYLGHLQGLKRNKTLLEDQKRGRRRGKRKRSDLDGEIESIKSIINEAEAIFNAYRQPVPDEHKSVFEKDEGNYRGKKRRQTEKREIVEKPEPVHKEKVPEEPVVETVTAVVHNRIGRKGICSIRPGDGYTDKKIPVHHAQIDDEVEITIRYVPGAIGRTLKVLNTKIL